MQLVGRPTAQILKHPGAFGLRTLKGFRANQGLLLAGAVAYYALLSIVPLLILTVIALSHFVDQGALLQTLGHYLEWLVPGQSKAIVAELANFLAHRDVLGLVLLASMLFFSSLAFTVLENAIFVLTSVYLVMPVGRPSLQHALLGALAAALLWELSRHALVWYFTTLSQIGTVYGSLTTAIAVLLSLEVAATLLLLGAQVISEYERLAGEALDAPPKPFTTHAWDKP